jgi:hypothetical protein
LGNSGGKLKKAKSGRTTTQNSGQKSRIPKFPTFFVWMARKENSAISATKKISLSVKKNGGQKQINII